MVEKVAKKEREKTIKKGKEVINRGKRKSTLNQVKFDEKYRKGVIHFGMKGFRKLIGCHPINL